MSYLLGTQNETFAIINGEKKKMNCSKDGFIIEGEKLEKVNKTNKYGYFVSLQWREFDLCMFVNQEGSIYFKNV
jgi:hypothetical protein